MSAGRLSKSELNEDQQNALQFIKDFVADPERRQMVLYGAAGTGKTSLINVLLDEIDEQNKESESQISYVCTATTNKAVEVIANRTGRAFDSTVYSILGLVLQDYDDKKPKLVRENEGRLDQFDLMIVDEASMVSCMLLNEIQKQLRVFTSIKVVYVGDKCQIPPVDDANEGMMESIIFQLPVQFELTKVMRTADDNPILGVVTAMRADMTSEVDLFKHETSVAVDGTGIFFYNRSKEFMEKMLSYFNSDNFKNNTNYAMAVAWTNEAVDAINERVRAAIYPDSDLEYEVGEEVRVTKAYGIDTCVGRNKRIRRILFTMEERLKVHTCDRCEDPVYGIDCYKVKVENVYAARRNRLTCTAYIVSGKGMDEYVKIRADLAEKAKLKLEQVDRHGKRLFTPKEAWAEYSAFKRFFLFVGYIYALTTHKAQGSTIDNVFAVERNINRIPETELRNKLKYTAFTRAARELHVLT